MLLLKKCRDVNYKVYLSVLLPNLSSTSDNFITLVKLFLKLDIDWKIITAFSRKEEIAKARLKQSDLISLDVAMPEPVDAGVNRATIR